MYDHKNRTLGEFYAELIGAKGGVQTPRLLDAFRKVKKEPFAGTGPWDLFIPNYGYVKTPNEQAEYLYDDHLIGICRERQINIGQPSLHIKCINALDIKSGDRVAHVGCGVGYYTSIIAELVEGEGNVTAYEIEPDLAVQAAENVSERSAVTVVGGTGIGAILPLSDVIYVNAGVSAPDTCWLEALTVGGRLLFPLQGPNGRGGMLLVTRIQPGDWFRASFISRSAFINAKGTEPSEFEKGLATLFMSPQLNRVKALVKDTAPDDTCLYRGNGWWLSSNSPLLEGPPAKTMHH